MLDLRRTIVAFTFFACSPDLTVPPGVGISCVTQADCPDGSTCVVDVGRCITPGADDVPPEVEPGSFSVEPAVVPAGGVLTVGFQASEELGRHPRVFLVWPSEEREASIQGVTTSTREYVYRYASGSTEPAGPADIRIELLDLGGNPGQGSFDDRVAFDADAPDIVPMSVAITLEPPTGALVTSVSAASHGAIVKVSFTATELLSAATEVRTPAMPQRIDFADATAPGSAPDYEFQVTLAAAPAVYAQGSYDLEVEAVDQAGNRNTVSLGSFVVDTSSPAAPDLAEITYRRSPWGSDEMPTVAAGAQTVVGRAGAVEGGATVIAAANGSLVGLVRLGESTAAADGSFQIDLSGTQAPDVWSVSVDTAANASNLVKISDNIWQASLIGRRAASDLENPNRVRFSQILMESPISQHGYEPGNSLLSRLASVDPTGSDIVFSPGGRGWRERNVGIGGLSTFFSGLAYDSLRGEILNYGGFITLLRDVPEFWRWDGVGWQVIQTSGPSPSQRNGAAMAYDPVRDRTVLFGGGSEIDSPVDTWEWTGSEWLQVTSAPNEAPTPRFYGAMVYDRLGERVVLFGGCGDLRCTGVLNDLWAWDGDAWTNITPSGSSPPPRYLMAMARDNNDEIVLFGGCNSGDLFTGCSGLGDTWVFDGTAWQERCMGGLCSGMAGPAPRHSAAMAIDPFSGSLVMVGGSIDADLGCGSVAGTNPVDEVWTWSGSAWSLASFNAPDCRAALRLVPQPGRDRLVLLGGWSPSPSTTADVWEWDNSAWDLVSRGGADLASDDWPPARIDATLSYDPGHRLTLLWGGEDRDGNCDSAGEARCGDLWGWDGSHWLELLEHSSVMSAPDPRWGHTMVFDPIGRVSLLFGGVADSSMGCDGGTYQYCDSVWSLENPGSGWAWTLDCFEGGCGAMRPVARASHAMAYDSDRDVVVMFGGHADVTETPDCGMAPNTCPCFADTEGTECFFGDTWEYSGGSWREVCGGPTGGACGPAPRRLARMAYDDARDRMVLYGGHQADNDPMANPNPCNSDAMDEDCDDTWVFASGTWTQICGPGGLACAPPVRNGGAMAYDAARARVILSGGYPDFPDSAYDDTWELLNVRWRKVGSFIETPPRRVRQAFTYDTRRDRMIMFGGQMSSESYDDTFELHTGPGPRPSAVFSFAWFAAGAMDTAITSITLNLRVGARGFTQELNPASDLEGDPVPGFNAWIWDASRLLWEQVGSATVDSIAPGLTTLSATGTFSDYVVPSDGRIYVRLEPTTGSGNGNTSALLALDYVEVLVGYD